MSENNTADKEGAGCIAKDFMEGTPFEEFEEQEQQDLIEQVREGSIRANTDNFLIIEQ